MTIREVADALRRWWWALLLAPVIGTVVGQVVASQVPPQYEGDARLLVGPIIAPRDVVDAASGLTDTYAELLTSDVVLLPVGDELGMDIDPRQVFVTPDAVTRLLGLRVRDNDPEVAARITNTLAEELVAITSPTTTASDGAVVVIDRAEVPTAPAAPDVGLITVLSGIAALLVALSLVLLLEYFDRSIRTESDLVRAAGARALGVVRRPSRRSQKLWTGDDQVSSRLAAAYRLFAAKVEHDGRDAPTRSILVTGASGRADTSELSANLAAALTSSGKTVALVDADTAGGVSRLFEVSDRRGMSDVVRLPDARAAAEQLVRSRRNRLAVLPKGRARSDGALSSDTAAGVLQSLLAARDIVVLDAGSVSGSSSLAWADQVDASLLVAQRGLTTEPEVERAVRTLDAMSARLVGVVLELGRGSRPGARPASRFIPAGTASRSGGARKPADGGKGGKDGKGGRDSAGVGGATTSGRG